MGRKPLLSRRLRFPLIVKSLFFEASTGISQASVVENEDQLLRRVQFIHEHLETAAIVEQFIQGRELYVGVLGHDRLDVLPVWEMSFAQMPDNRWRIATRTSQMEHQVSEEAWHRHSRGPARRRRIATHPAHRQAHVPSLGSQRLRANRPPAGRGRTPGRPRGQPEPEHRVRGRFRRIGGGERLLVRTAPRTHSRARSTVDTGTHQLTTMSASGDRDEMRCATNGPNSRNMSSTRSMTNAQPIRRHNPRSLGPARAYA